MPSGALLDLALRKALNDTQTVANRQTLPTNVDSSALTFVTQPSPISVIASPGSLPNGNIAADAQGLWLRLTLLAGIPPYSGAADIRATGASCLIDANFSRRCWPASFVRGRGSIVRRGRPSFQSSVSVRSARRAR
jgi:hypothetical protein